MNIFCHFCFTFFAQFSLCTRIKLRTRDGAYQMKQTFHVWGLWIIFRPFFDTKTVIIKIFHIKAKQKCILILSIRNEVYQAQICCIKGIPCSLNTAHLQCFKSRTHSWHTSNLVKKQRDVRFSHQLDLGDKSSISPNCLNTLNTLN